MGCRKNVAQPAVEKTLTFEDDALVMRGCHPDVKVSAWPDLRIWVRNHPDAAWIESPGWDRICLPAKFWRVCQALNTPGHQHMWDEFTASGRSEYTDRNCACLTFAERIPAQIRRWCLDFKLGRQRVLEAFARLGQPARDLAQSGAWTLLSALAHYNGFLRDPDAWSWEQVAQLLRRRQRDIWQVLLRCGEEGFARLMRKCVQALAHPSLFWRMPELYRRDSVRHLMAHLPVINPVVAKVLEKDAWRQRCTPRLLQEIARYPDCTTNAGSYLEMIETVFRHPSARAKYFSLAAIDADALEWWMEKNKNGSDINRDEKIHFPDPPLPGIEELIEPITTIHKLRAEGRTMQNCLSHATPFDVLFGASYIYRIHSYRGMDLQRATLEIVRDGDDDCWRIGQLYGPANEAVNVTTLTLVQRYLRYAQEPRVLAARQMAQYCLYPLQLSLPYPRQLCFPWEWFSHE